MDFDPFLRTSVDSSDLHCAKNALTDMFGWFLQILLASLAFTCLILKRWCEPYSERRPWKIWWYDTSKQGLGALVIHMFNIVLSEKFQGDPCTWYVINFLLDSSIGLLIVCIGIRLCQYLSRIWDWEVLNFGEYGKPPSIYVWLVQCLLYVLLMVVVKVTITLLMQLKFWEEVKDFVLSPIPNPVLELTVVMLVIPFFINALIFWVTDNYLMKHNRTKKTSIFQRVKVQYQKLNRHHSESESVPSGDDELLVINPYPSQSRKS